MSEGEFHYTDLYRDVVPAVVSIYVDAPDARTGRGAGSGFVYDRTGHVVTNHHVVAGLARDGAGRSRGLPDESGSPTLEIRFSDGDWRVGRLVGTDPYTDLAVVAVDDLPAAATPLPVASTNPAPGQPVAAFGNPMGLDGTITTGIVSGVSRTMPVGGGFTIPDVVQTDAPINPGNSGGPLVAVTADGTPEVVGVNRARSGDNIGFAISPAVVARVVPDLLETGRCEHATLRVTTLDVSPAVADANDLTEPGGVLVVDVREGPASGVLGGCHSSRRVRGREVPVGGDVLVGIDGEDIRSTEELTSYLLTETWPGETAELTVRRPAGETRETVQLGTRIDPGENGEIGGRIAVQ
ncbi:S1C family serine protease [Natronorubrum halophilum]|uniref:S1C family serine protease n=1 Tax=Natronorubrum halophilum TaxID=1702106 RepID=UPI0010C20685|nr:trypsin-like peptidase domain-containing protein [Natronorubrum halophilum]